MGAPTVAGVKVQKGGGSANVPARNKPKVGGHPGRIERPLGGKMGHPKGGKIGSKKSR